MPIKSLPITIKLRDFCNTVKDEGTSVDVGLGFNACDLWVTVHGVEWFITVTKSNAQKQKEAKHGFAQQSK
jgi:hypothetical protein